LNTHNTLICTLISSIVNFGHRVSFSFMTIHRDLAPWSPRQGCQAHSIHTFVHLPYNIVWKVQCFLCISFTIEYINIKFCWKILQIRYGLVRIIKQFSDDEFPNSVCASSEISHYHSLVVYHP